MQVSNWDVHMDFFKANPQYLSSEVFSSVKEQYKKEYSNILWAIALINDPDSIYRNLSKETKIKKVSHLLPKDIKKEFINTITKEYLELCETHPMRMLRIWKEKLDEKLEFMSENRYTVDYYEEVVNERGSVRNILRKGTWEMLEALQAGNVKAYKEYEEIMKQLNKESEGKSLGGEEKSLSDKGGLL